MFNKKIEDDSEHSFWISYADMLTGFLISFMVIALLLASKAKEIDCSKCPPPCKTRGDKCELFKEFAKEMKNWETVTIADSATLRFNTVDNNMLFDSGEDNPSPYFLSVLQDFSPTFNRVMYELLMEKGYDIKEIRFEGHTDQTPITVSETSYFDNLHLSARRASNIQRLLVSMADNATFDGIGYYKPYDSQKLIEFKNKLFNLSVSCGYSYTKRLNDNGVVIPICPENADVTNPCKEPYNEEKSRRIEIRIIGSDKK